MAVAQIQIRRGTTAEWTSASPVVLASGEPGFDTTLHMHKIGDGSTEWASLPWVEDITIVNVLSEGIVGDGSDETTLAQAALDKAVALNGTFYIPKGLTVTVDQLTLTSESNFKIVVDGVLKRIANGTDGPSDDCGMLYFYQCTDFEIATLHGDANIANNAGAVHNDVNELMHILQLHQCNRVHLGYIEGYNVAGDVLYIMYCDDIICDTLYGHAGYTGRQTLSITGGERMQFSNIISNNVGMYLMPGGVDIEPEANPWGVEQRIARNIEFGNVYISSRAECCFSISNNFGIVTESNLTASIIENITVNNLICRRPYSPADGHEHLGIVIRWADNVKISNAIVYEDHVHSAPEPISMNALSIEGCNNVDIGMSAYNVNIGAKVGVTFIYTGVDAVPTNNLNLHGDIDGTQLHGMSLGNCNNSEFKLQIRNTTNGLILIDYLSTLDNLVFRHCDFSKASTGLCVVDMFKTTTTGMRFVECDFTGWADTHKRLVEAGFADDVGCERCKGVNYADAMPTEGYFQAGEYVENTTPAVAGSGGSQYVINGWRRITTGTDNVLNTDWVQDRALTGT